MHTGDKRASSNEEDSDSPCHRSRVGTRSNGEEGNGNQGRHYESNRAYRHSNPSESTVAAYLLWGTDWFGDNLK
jgi:hypothetical protein